MFRFHRDTESPLPMAADPRATSPLNPTATDGIVCPFCAHVRGRDAQGACPKCTMEDTIITRRSTGERIGPWFVLQRKNPTAPGLRFAVLLTLARRGHVTGKSIVRGPTTGQLWRYAAEVKGLSRLFGVCWHCHGGVSPDATTCPRCKSAQEIPDDPDVFLENQASVPMMRDFSSAPDAAPFSDAPVGVANEERLPARPTRLPADLASRRPPAQRPERADGFDTVEDLSRALALGSANGENDAGRPPRRASRGNGTGEVILSASELAAAFSLNAPPPSLATRTRRGLWTLIKISFVVLILVGIAGVVAGYLKPEWRKLAQDKAQPYLAQAQDWWQQAYAKARGTSTTNPSTMTSSATISTTPDPADGSLPPPTPIHLEDGGKSPTFVARSTSTPTPSVVDITPTTKPAVVPETKPAVVATRPPLTDTAPVRVESKPEPKVEQAKAAETKSEQKPAKGELTLDEAIAQAAELRNNALDAEARRDWRAAVIIYEQIRTLPEAAQPSDLKVRLSLAKDRLAGR